MRSHTKASSVGSNSGRGASHRSLRRPGALAALLVAFVAAACLLPGSAFAVERRPLAESFGLDGTSGTEFEHPAGLAFDQGNKRLYVDEEETRKIYGYDASTPATRTPLGGNFPLNAPGFGGFDGLAVNSSSHNIYYSSAGENTLFGYDSSGAALSGFPISGQNFACGTATDSAGNVWVAHAFENTLNKYSPAGVLLGTVSTSSEPCSLAFDSNDNLYVGYFFGGTAKYTAASNYTASTPIDAEVTNAVTVDPSTDEVYVAHNNYISVYKPNGTFFYEFGKSIAGEAAEFTGVAIDSATELAYVSSNAENKVLVFDPPLPFPEVSTGAADAITPTSATLHGTVNPNGTALTDCHFEFVPASQFFNDGYASVTSAQEAPCVPAASSIPADSNDHAVSAEVSGLTNARTYHYRLVSSNSSGTANGLDHIFTTGALAPLVEGQSAEAVGTVDATVTALINPRGGETTYHVEYGTTNAYGQSTPETLPFGSPTDTTPHEVRVHIAGLQPGAAYHFRFVATNPAGVTQGADATLATYSTPPSFGACPNDRFRTGFGSHLPDCRAYEQATPTDKHGANAQLVARNVAASADGDRVTFYNDGGLPTTGGSSDLNLYLASRGPDGWSFDGIQPPTDPGQVSRTIGWSEDLSSFLTAVPNPGNTEEVLYLRDSATANFQLGPASPGIQSLESTRLYGYAADTSHLAFMSWGALLPESPAKKAEVYDLDHGDLTLAGRIPAGSSTVCDDEAGPACVIPAQGTSEGSRGSISRDGSRVVFAVTNPGQPFGTGRIYMREDGTRTTWISASQRTVPDPNGEKPAIFVGASADGSTVFFLSCEKLTDDSTAVSTGASSCEAEGEGQDLYAYDADTGDLTDLTVDSNAGDPLGAAVQSKEVQAGLGASQDGTHFYFFANGVLAPGAVHSNCAGYQVKCNLYVYDEGAVKLIARIPMGPGASTIELRVSPDGTALLFGSNESLTGYNNVGLCGNEQDPIATCNEIYRYSAPDEELVCISCNPTGAKPTGHASLTTSDGILTGTLGYASLSRNLSANGDRAFFESPDPLLPNDTNGVRDVYEWEAQGSGSCNTAGGCIYLLSDGTGEDPSSFVDASTNGDHAFVKTFQQLVPRDEDQLSDIYDVGVNGGVAAQHSLTPPTCTSTACQANPPPPPDQTLSSASFSGPGNLKEHSSARKCPKGKRKVRQGTKVHCKAKRKQHKRHNNRGGSK